MYRVRVSVGPCIFLIPVKFRNFHSVHSEEKYQKNAITLKIFREINPLVISLVKKRWKDDEFSVKTVIVFLTSFSHHSVEIRETYFWQKFRESSGFTKEITK